VKNGLGFAPYDHAGNLMHFPSDFYEAAVTWATNDPFEVWLTIESVRSGRSAKYVVWTSPLGRQFPMFVTDLVDMIKRGSVSGGRCKGPWMVRKRGMNYGLVLAP
jgi:hypothetical protein